MTLALILYMLFWVVLLSRVIMWSWYVDDDTRYSHDYANKRKLAARLTLFGFGLGPSIFMCLWLSKSICIALYDSLRWLWRAAFPRHKRKEPKIPPQGPYR